MGIINLDCRRQECQLDRSILDTLTTWRTDRESDFMVAESERQGTLPIHRFTDVSVTSRCETVDTGATKNDETDQREGRSQVNEEMTQLGCNEKHLLSLSRHTYRFSAFTERRADSIKTKHNARSTVSGL
ncbi:Hypothetical protein, putative [Bodo saltans]|uniref:Uncharacterized protein n=1 Tax=Bodo saltans TaxID=75058 RepID=A0A0S4J6R3_BODSA|nr:Hypothetical protein, putative [Bodo saltans]|eukprot:CUG85715.1 Hypothetical protein, putative [Bodo saltans]